MKKMLKVFFQKERPFCIYHNKCSPLVNGMYWDDELKRKLKRLLVFFNPPSLLTLHLRKIWKCTLYFELSSPGWLIIVSFFCGTIWIVVPKATMAQKQAPGEPQCEPPFPCILPGQAVRSNLISAKETGCKHPSPPFSRNFLNRDLLSVLQSMGGTYG